MTEKIITRDQPMDADMAPYHQPEPYPVPVNLPQSINRGKLLATAYAGRNSEMTALSQYVVHHESMARNFQKVSHDILQIGIIEMFHLDMLGQCLLQLGVEPMLTAQGQFWGAHYLKYGCSPKERIIIDIQSEYDCIRSYREIIRCIDSQPIIDLLERIIRDEELHISLFEQMLPLVS